MAGWDDSKELTQDWETALWIFNSKKIRSAHGLQSLNWQCSPSLLPWGTHMSVSVCVCVCVCVCMLSHVQLFATPWTIAHQDPQSMGFFRQEYWSGLPFPIPSYRPAPGVKPVSPALVSRFFTPWPPGKFLSMGVTGYLGRGFSVFLAPSVNT